MTRRYLVDTRLLLWAASSSERLPPKARELLLDQADRVHFSAASIWEIAIKSSVGRTDFAVDAALFADALREHGYLELPITASHAARVALLPAVHRDPFDRMLVAQAQSEHITLVTHDPVVAEYPGPIQFV